VAQPRNQRHVDIEQIPPVFAEWFIIAARKSAPTSRRRRFLPALWQRGSSRAAGALTVKKRRAEPRAFVDSVVQRETRSKRHRVTFDKHMPAHSKVRLRSYIAPASKSDYASSLRFLHSANGAKGRAAPGNGHSPSRLKNRYAPAGPAPRWRRHAHHGGLARNEGEQNSGEEPIHGDERISAEERIDRMSIPQIAGQIRRKPEGETRYRPTPPVKQAVPRMRRCLKRTLGGRYREDYAHIRVVACRCF